MLTNFSEMDSDMKQILGVHEETDEMSFAAAGDEAVPVSEVQVLFYTYSVSQTRSVTFT